MVQRFLLLVSADKIDRRHVTFSVIYLQNSYQDFARGKTISRLKKLDLFILRGDVVVVVVVIVVIDVIDVIHVIDVIVVIDVIDVIVIIVMIVIIIIIIFIIIYTRITWESGNPYTHSTAYVLYSFLVTLTKISQLQYLSKGYFILPNIYVILFGIPILKFQCDD